MLYNNIIFPKISKRPFFYSNFVSTVDGKVQVLTNNQSKYWPIGSKTDYETLIELRTHADLLIHGKNTALGHGTLISLSKENFKKTRKRLNKNELLPYMVITTKPDEVIKYLKSYQGKIFIVTTQKAKIAQKSKNKNMEIVKLGNNHVDLKKLAKFLYEKDFRNVLVEGGPKLLGSFFSENLVDEVFLTIAPKIFNGTKNDTLTMCEGQLLKPKEVKKLKIISIKKVKDELYLRYKVTH